MVLKEKFDGETSFVQYTELNQNPNVLLIDHEESRTNLNDFEQTVTSHMQTEEGVNAKWNLVQSQSGVQVVNFDDIQNVPAQPITLPITIK